MAEKKKLRERSQVVDEAVKRTLHLLGGYKRGDVVPWAAIEGAAGFERYSTHWTAFVHRLKRDFLRSTGTVLWAVNAVGYELLTEKKTLTERTQKRLGRALRQTTRNDRELRHLPSESLTDHQKADRARQIQLGTQARRSVLGAIRDVHKQAKPQQADVPRVRPRPPHTARPTEPAA